MRDIVIKLILLIISGLVFSEIHAQSDSLYVKEHSGTIAAYSLGNINKISFSHGSLIIDQINDESVVYGLINLQHLTFRDTTTVAVEKEIIADDRLYLFPNPVKDILYIDISGSSATPEVLSIISLQGEVLKTHIIHSDGVVSVHMSHLANGLYFCHLQGKDVNRVVKIIKQ